MNAHEFIASIARALRESAAHGIPTLTETDVTGRCSQRPQAEGDWFKGLSADLQTRLRNQQCSLAVNTQGNGVLSVSDPADKYRVTLIFQVNQAPVA